MDSQFLFERMSARTPVKVNLGGLSLSQLQDMLNEDFRSGLAAFGKSQMAKDILWMGISSVIAGVFTKIVNTVLKNPEELGNAQMVPLDIKKNYFSGQVVFDKSGTPLFFELKGNTKGSFALFKRGSKHFTENYPALFRPDGTPNLESIRNLFQNQNYMRKVVMLLN